MFKKPLLVTFLIFIVMFIIEFKFSFLRDFDVWLLKIFIGRSAQSVVASIAELFYASFYIALLFSFMMTLPFADYFWRRYSVGASKTPNAWKYPLISLVVFIGGFLLASFIQYQRIHSLYETLNVEQIAYSMTSLLFELIKLQSLIGVTFLAVWFVLRRRKAHA